MATQIDAKAKAIMLFSQLSNINFGYAASIKDLETNSNRITEIITTDNVASRKIKELWDCKWEVAWGPALYYSKNLIGNHHANNSMYVVQGIDSVTGKNVYVVAIAGTNKLSRYEMISEDVDVKTVELWNSHKPECGNISNGSMTGLEKVLGKFDYGDNGITLMDFFEAEVKTHGQEKMEIITCGHSLGGALSPLVALTIKEAYKDIHVSTYPTAGPTSGDDIFAKYLETTLGEGNYISVINTNDIVPMAWEQDSLKAIPDIYDNEQFGYIEATTITFGDITIDIHEFISNRAGATEKNNYTRIAKDKEQTFTGAPTKQIDFMKEAMDQHTTLYFQEFFKGEGEETFSEEFSDIVYKVMLKQYFNDVNI